MAIDDIKGWDLARPIERINTIERLNRIREDVNRISQLIAEIDLRSSADPSILFCPFRRWALEELADAAVACFSPRTVAHVRLLPQWLHESGLSHLIESLDEFGCMELLLNNEGLVRAVMQSTANSPEECLALINRICVFVEEGSFPPVTVNVDGQSAADLLGDEGRG